MQKYFSSILVIYIYMLPILNLFSPLITDTYIRYAFLILIFLLAFIGNRLRVNLKFITVISIIAVFSTINALVVPHQNFVITDAIAIVIYSIVPLYLFLHKLIDNSVFVDLWGKISVIFTVILPIFYLFRSLGYISYFDLAYVAHLNILILIYYIFLKQKLWNIVFIIVNFIFLAVFGSRMMLLASIICLAAGIFFLRKSLKFYIVSFLFIGIGWLVYKNFLSILIYINSFIQDNGFNSRNLNLFILQFSGNQSNSEVVLSGRDAIYPIIMDYLAERGFFPSGLGMTRVLTQDVYYHSHNFFLETSLILGYILSAILFIYFAVKFCRVVNSEFNYIVILLAVSFAIRSTTGTYFVTDMLFMTMIAVLVGNSRNRRRLK